MCGCAVYVCWTDCGGGVGSEGVDWVCNAASGGSEGVDLVGGGVSESAWWRWWFGECLVAWAVVVRKVLIA